MSEWMPCASLNTLRAVGKLRHAIREWMCDQQILEVCTPVLSGFANTDASLEPLTTTPGSGSPDSCRFLHTSPEFAMKRLLAAYPGVDIYQIASVFRADEQGRFHSAQFSLLEWYRVGLDHHALMLDVEQLLVHVFASMQLDKPCIQTCSYCDAVESHLGAYPDELDAREIHEWFLRHDRSFPAALGEDRDACLDLFMDEFVLPDFAKDCFTFLTDYPASQAALARVGANESGLPVAERFELYFGKVELANGFHELTDAAEQRSRFNTDLDKRRLKGKKPLPMDEHFLSALEHGLSACAGVALGLDRLMMVIGGYEHIREVLSFDDQRA